MVILDSPTKGHVTQRIRNPKIVMVRYVQQKGSYDIASISETTTTIDKKFHDNICTTKMYPASTGDAVLWRHNKSKMADGRHIEDH